MTSTANEELEERQRVLLRAVIVEYIDAAEPVASEKIVSRYNLGIKSATVRNELAHMAELGYLEQPHTSAGRVPSDKGYRYFVDHLAIRKDPDTEEKQSVRSVAQEGELLDALLRDTTRALSRLTHLLSAAALVRDANLTVKSALVSALGSYQALVVLVMANGHAESRVVECPSGISIEDLGIANQTLAKEVVGKTLRVLSRAKVPVQLASPSQERLIGSVWPAIKAMAKELTRGALVTEGEEFLFGQPEFRSDAGGFATLLDSLKSDDVLYEALSSPDQAGTVTIGKENRSEKMHKLSVIRHTFHVGETEAGTIAIIGPTRMQYEKSIPLVNFTAKALSDALTRYFG